MVNEDFEVQVRKAFKSANTDIKTLNTSLLTIASDIKSMKALFDKLNKKVDVYGDKMSILEKNLKAMVRVEGEDEDDADSNSENEEESDEKDSDSLY